MAKPKTIYICSSCAAEFSQWFGKCSNCDTYDSLVEQNISAFIGDIPSRSGVGNWQAGGHSKSHNKPAKARSALTFDQISDRQIARWESGYGELDRVLGGGIVPGSMVLIGGDPGWDRPGREFATDLGTVTDKFIEAVSNPRIGTALPEGTVVI